MRNEREGGGGVLRLTAHYICHWLNMCLYYLVKQCGNRFLPLAMFHKLLQSGKKK